MAADSSVSKITDYIVEKRIAIFSNEKNFFVFAARTERTSQSVATGTFLRGNKKI